MFESLLVGQQERRKSFCIDPRSTTKAKRSRHRHHHRHQQSVAGPPSGHQPRHGDQASAKLKKRLQTLKRTYSLPTELSIAGKNNSCELRQKQPPAPRTQTHVSYVGCRRGSGKIHSMNNRRRFHENNAKFFNTESLPYYSYNNR